MWGLSPVAASRGHSSSQCAGLSLSWPLLLRSTGSRRAGSVVVAHGPSCSAACGIFPDQGSNPCPLHWQAESQPLRHQGSPPHSLIFNLWLPAIFFPVPQKWQASNVGSWHLKSCVWSTQPWGGLCTWLFHSGKRSLTPLHVTLFFVLFFFYSIFYYHNFSIYLLSVTFPSHSGFEYVSGLSLSLLYSSS